MSSGNITVKIRSAPIKVDVVGGVGARGYSNYQIYLATYPDPVLTEVQWLATLVTAIPGPMGPTGPSGGGGGNGNITVSTEAPADPAEDDQWFDPETNTMSVWYFGVIREDDAWVQTN